MKRAHYATLQRVPFILATVLGAVPASAEFNTFVGDQSVQAMWQAAAGGNPALETFDGFASGTEIQALPLLGIALDPLIDSTYPIAYTGYPYTYSACLANVLAPGEDFVLRPALSGTLWAVGAWNIGTDDTLRYSAYDASDALLGFVDVHPVGEGQPFAGFVSTIPVERVVISELGGDGYIGIDNLQTNLPEPASAALIGFALMGVLRRRPARR